MGVSRIEIRRSGPPARTYKGPELLDIQNGTMNAIVGSMTNKKKTAAKTTVEAHARILATLARIQNGADKLLAQSQADPRSWGYAGSLQHVAEELNDLAIFLGE